MSRACAPATTRRTHRVPNRSEVNVDGEALPESHVRHVPWESTDVAVRNLIVRHLDVDANTVTEGATFRDDLGADSLDAFDLLMAIEERFGIEIPDEAADSMSSVGDAVAYIEAHLAPARTQGSVDRAPDSQTRNPH